ncbi:YIP1 family protein [Corallococcus llansteffanensis]|uniref:YIP1 family protein n=1 Tax=Corallococcus llansteffanensis TaxID=2316731 RepID=A0A3A8PVW7_9BACT|nr:YIP1 family protein [Corallococcus llansteffanensis]RKH60533.1 YIP1 family protein [Corallococcus llansteffanensis]
MTSLVQPARIFVDPFEGTRAAVEGRRWLWPLLILAFCVTVSGIAYALRWDATAAVVGALPTEVGAPSVSESDIADQIQTASRKALVGGIAKGLLLMPLEVLLLACVLWVTAWLFSKPASFGQLMAAAAVAMLPIALYHLIFAVCAGFQHSLTDLRAERLVPSSLALLDGLSPKLQRVLRGVDFFNLWSVGLLGVGFSTATGMRLGRALLLTLVLYIMYAGIVFIRIPTLGGP